eukprot:2056658-Pyramimonas_sp.AAC.1
MSASFKVKLGATVRLGGKTGFSLESRRGGKCASGLQGGPRLDTHHDFACGRVGPVGPSELTQERGLELGQAVGGYLGGS